MISRIVVLLLITSLLFVHHFLELEQTSSIFLSNIKYVSVVFSFISIGIWRTIVVHLVATLAAYNIYHLSSINPQFAARCPSLFPVHEENFLIFIFCLGQTL
jgi:hypothetical protein